MSTKKGASFSFPPIVERWYSFCDWLLPKIGKFRKDQRYMLGERLQQASLDVLEYLTNAATSSLEQKRNSDVRAQKKVEHIRFLLRLCSSQRLLSLKSHEYAAKHLVEVGRMLGGWKKQVTATQGQGVHEAA